ncbi:MAG TPA: glycosyltransferase family 39 protein [Terriglobales bacterium]|nr:glycosyltransferase family 39 protein [Terriglobales bacterium]
MSPDCVEGRGASNPKFEGQYKREGEILTAGMYLGLKKTLSNLRIKWPWIVAAISILALNALLLFALIPEVSSRMNWLYNSDGYVDTYEQIAENLAVGNGYRVYPDTARTLSREPGYPILLAGVFLVFGDNLTTVKLANMLFTFAAAGLIALLARRVSASRVVTLGAPLVFLFHPGTLIAESRGGVETPFTLFLVLFMLMVYRAIESRAWFDYLLSGAALGSTVLIRSTPILFPVWLLAYLAAIEPKQSWFRLCRNGVIMATAAVTILSPWIIRNYSLVGKFVPTASVLGISAHAGLYNNTHYSGAESWAMVDRQGARERRELAEDLGYPFKVKALGYFQDFYSSQDEVRFSDYLLKRVIGEYRSSPSLFVKCVGANLFNFWFRGKTMESTRLNLILEVPYLFLAMAGFVMAVRDGLFNALAPVLLLIAYLVAVSVVVLAQARYSVPLIPFLSILVCLAVDAITKQVGWRPTADERNTVVLASASGSGC